MRDIKFSYMWQNGKYWIEHIWTLDNIEGGDHYDEMSDNPMLKNYRLKVRRQYTGLKDENGKEIYEGDIVKTLYEKYPNQFPGTYYPNGKHPKKIEWITSSHHNGWNIYYGKTTVFEIIGNIYENPELLKEV